MQNPVPYNCRIEAVHGDVMIICPDSGREIMAMTPTETMELVAELRQAERIPEELAETCARLESAAQSAARQVGVVRGAFWLHEALAHACEMMAHNSDRDQREDPRMETQC